MAETKYDELMLGDTDDEGKSVLISQSADRPNAFNSYRESKMSAAEVKAMFDRPFLFVKKRFNALLGHLKIRDKDVNDKLAAQDTKLTAQDEEIKRIAEKADSINNYDLTDADKKEIAEQVLSEFVDGNDVPYTGEEVSEDG